jgi:hypothetical protein
MSSSSPSPRYTKTELNSMKVNELRELLESMDINSAGNKTDLVKRAVKANIHKEGELSIDVNEDLKYKILQPMMTEGPFYKQMQYALAGKDRIRIEELKRRALDVTITVNSNHIQQSHHILQPNELAEFYTTAIGIQSNAWNITIENEWIKLYIDRSQLLAKFKNIPATRLIYNYGVHEHSWDLSLHYTPGRNNPRKITVTYVQMNYRGSTSFELYQDILLGIWWAREWLFTEIAFSKLLTPGETFKPMYIQMEWRDENLSSQAQAHGDEMLSILKKIGKA